MECHISEDGVRNRVPGCNELHNRHPYIDTLAGLMEGKKCIFEDDKGLLKVAEGGEEQAEAIDGGIPAKAADEMLALGDVVIHDRMHDGKDIEVAHHCILKDVEKVVRDEVLDELAGFEGGELEGVKKSRCC